MVLGLHGPGRVGRRRFFIPSRPEGRLESFNGRDGRSARRNRCRPDLVQLARRECRPAPRSATAQGGTAPTPRNSRRATLVAPARALVASLAACSSDGSLVPGALRRVMGPQPGTRGRRRHDDQLAPCALDPSQRAATTSAGDRCDPKRSGRPEAAQVRWSFARPARPSSQTGRRRAGWSGAPCRLMGYRRDADLCAWRDLSWPAPARVTIGWPAVRVLARGGGGGPVWGLCLTQRRERGGRVYGLAHQLAQRALPRAAGDRRGEHVFGRLGTGSDGTRNVRRSDHHSARIWLWAAIRGRDGCNRSCTDGFRGRHDAGWAHDDRRGATTRRGARRRRATGGGPGRRDRPG